MNKTILCIKAFIPPKLTTLQISIKKFENTCENKTALTPER